MPPMDVGTLAIIGGSLAALIGAVGGGTKQREAETRGKNAVAIASAEWRRDVREPVSDVGPFGAARIDQYIRGPFGLTWGGADVADLSLPVPYTRDGQFEWCGAFVAWVLGQVGLSERVRKRHLASTYRLYQWAKNTPRSIPLNNIQPGDIVVVGPANDEFGKHVTLAASKMRADGTFDTYEGNAGGTGPTGERITGVVKQTRSITKPDMPRSRYRAAFAVRPLPEDYV
jgi:hypothetical protein